MRQEYQVFRTSRGDYVVFSRSNRSSTSFHMTFVPATRVKVLQRKIPKEGTTSGALVNDKKVIESFGVEDRAALYFEVLTTLYVMAALGIVAVSKSGRNLVFKPTMDK